MPYVLYYPPGCTPSDIPGYPPQPNYLIAKELVRAIERGQSIVLPNSSPEEVGWRLEWIHPCDILTDGAGI